MGLLFSKEGIARLDALVRPGLLCAFDFDGTLAPLVPMPEQATLPGNIRERLVRLSVLAPVAIITGRSVEDIRPRLGFDPDFVVGNHGLEGVPGWDDQSERYRQRSLAWMKQLGGLLSERFPDPGIMIENKQFSISLHYRMARDPVVAERTLNTLLEELTPPPRVIGGKYVFNLIAEDACHKGLALDRLMKTCGARTAIYVGDDVTDEDVFRMRLRDVLSVRVERHEESAADFFIARLEDMNQLLDELAIRLQSQRAINWLQEEKRNRA